MTWREHLQPYLASGSVLFDTAFLGRWGNELWAPKAEDRQAAEELHRQLTSRITTQKLGYLDGVEQTALQSVYSLFEHTRAIGDKYSGCRHFDETVWHVLNSHVRPFTAKWHLQSTRGNLAALDATDEFRAELADLQQLLHRFDDFLLHLRDDRPPVSSPQIEDAREIRISHEMARPLTWGIPNRLGDLDSQMVGKINEAERQAIRARRNHYGFPEDKPHAAALAISGGGIRSATFSLGVLVALAKKNILPQFDYLSTVSGGGYLGSFLTAFLNSTEVSGAPDSPSIGLKSSQLPFRRDEGEAEALRHIRHHSKYLTSGSLWERAKMIFAQLYGMFLHGLGIVLLVAMAVLFGQFLRHRFWFSGLWSLATLGVTGALLAVAIISPLLLRLGTKSQTVADGSFAGLVLLLVGLLGWRGLTYCQDATLNWSLLQWLTLLAFLGLIPLIASIFSSLAGRAFRLASPISCVLGGVAAPAFFFVTCLALSAWMEKSGPILQTGIYALDHPVLLVSGILVLATLFFCFLNINDTSPHRHYRNKLAEAYLIQPAESPTLERPFKEAVSLRLSAIGRPQQRGPYHLINCALNVPTSTNSSMQGRRTDFFTFSPAFCGSPLIGYKETVDWEKVDSHLDLATAMAASGAAAAPQMGLSTSKSQSFWLALLNIRLGYWVRNPQAKPKCFEATPGLGYLLKEMLGWMDEKSAWLNVSDGGHIENLGVYELLRRRCKYIVAIDGEHDPRMTFAALTTLQRLAAIDLRIRIDINLDDLRLDERGLSRSHFRFCRIEYPEKTYGYLLYLKLSLTGNEGEFLRRYKLDEPAFPHHSTADQFFTEAQFEAYRSLGEHIGDKLFLEAIIGPQKNADSITLEEWFEATAKTLLEPLSETAVAAPIAGAGTCGC